MIADSLKMPNPSKQLFILEVGQTEGENNEVPLMLVMMMMMMTAAAITVVWPEGHQTETRLPAQDVCIGSHETAQNAQNWRFCSSTLKARPVENTCGLG